MEIKTVDKKFKETTESVKLNDAIWSVPMKQDLVVQVVNIYKDNKRSANASVKDRGDVRGGGRKPWRQKGTGRARHGSTRSPIWVGGGVTFGPTDNNWKKSVNKKMKLGAMACVLSERLRNQEVHFMKSENIDKGVADLKKVIVVTDDNSVFKSIRNIEGVRVVPSTEVNAMDLLYGKRLLVDSGSIAKLEARFA